jgi:hypothetical protein
MGNACLVGFLSMLDDVVIDSPALVEFRLPLLCLAEQHARIEKP